MTINSVYGLRAACIHNKVPTLLGNVRINVLVLC